MTVLKPNMADFAEISRWESRFKDCQSSRRAFEDQWYMQMAFYYGRQWANWKRSTNGTGNRLVEPPAPRNRVRLVTNKVKSYTRKEHSKLTKEEPIWYVVPNTSEPDDVSAARAAEAISQYILKKANFSGIRRRATFWTVLTGNGFIKTTCPDTDADIILESISPFHMFVPDIQEETLEAQPYVIHARGLSVDTVKSMWGIDVEGDINSSGATLEQKFFSALGVRPENQASRKLVYVKEIWVRPGGLKEYPNGCMMVIADNKIVYRYTEDQEEAHDPVGEDESEDITTTNTGTSVFPDVNSNVKKSAYPYEHGEFPFKKFDHIPTGSFYTDSTIKDLISPQREYNKTRSQMIESKNRTSKPPLIYPKGALNPKMVTSEAGQFIPINVGFDTSAVHYLTSPDLPMYVTAELGILHGDMDEIASQSAVSRGGAPPGVDASSAISFLAEQNDSTLHITVAAIETAIEGIGLQSISLAQQYWTDEKTVKVVSANYSQDAQLFKVSDINGNADLRLEAGSIAPQSQAAKQAFLMGLADRGFPLEKVLRYLGMNETQRMYDELQVDSRQAQRENYLMRTQTVPHVDPKYTQPYQMSGPDPQRQLSLNPEMGGMIQPDVPPVEPMTSGTPTIATGTPGQEVPNMKPFPVNPYDDHTIHMYEHGMFMKTNQFETLDPVIKQVMLQHWLMHQQSMEQSIARSNQLGQPESGAGQQSGPPEPAGNPSGQPS